MKNLNIYMKIILSSLLFICLLDMPYGYFQLVRFAGLISFTTFAFHAHKNNRKNEMIIYCILALLFQPFFKVALGRELWNIVDVLVGTGLIISIFVKTKEK